MQTNVREAVRDALAALIDYAGLFPPAQLEMAHAVPEYLAARGGRYAWMLGRFVVPCSRITQLLDVLPAAERCRVSVILDGGIENIRQIAAVRDTERRLALEGLEIVLEPDGIERYAAELSKYGLSAVPSYVEFRRDEGWARSLADGLPALARCELSAKVRCGGATAQAFPSPGDLASFVRSAADQGLTFKATAGLHHPVRHFNAAAGVTMHGFLNVLAAAQSAVDGGSAAEIERTLASEDPNDFAFGGSGITAAARRLFAGYGSCSFAEPVGDLRAMGVLA